MSAPLQLAVAPAGAGPDSAPSIRVVFGDDRSLVRRNLRCCSTGRPGSK
jgi:hypothetical protein